MNIFIAALPEGSDLTELSIDPEAFPRTIQLNNAAWVIAADVSTPSELGEKLGLHREDDDNGNGHDRTWVIFKIVEDGYFGYAVASLWQKLTAWERDK